MFLLSSTIDFKLFADDASGAGLTSAGTGLTDGGTLLTSSFGSGLAAGAGAAGGGAAGAGAAGGVTFGAGAGVTGAATTGFPRSSLGGGVGFTSSFFSSLEGRLNIFSKRERLL